MKFDLRHAVFPIVPFRHHDDDAERIYCDPGELGSAFLISRDGVFLTAKHVVTKWSVDSYAIFAIHVKLKGYKPCRVQAIESHPELDVAIGQVEVPGAGGWPHPFILSGSRVGIGSAVLFFGYAGTAVTPRRDLTGEINLEDSLKLDFNPQPHRGHVVDHVPRAPLIGGPCYQVSIDPGGGISGSPLIRQRTGSVHGIFNAGMPATEGAADATGFVTDVAAFLDSWNVSLLGDLTLREYARRVPGRIVVR